MTIRSQLGATLVLVVMTASVAWAQTAPASSQEPIRLNLLIEAERVRFTKPDSLEWRLEIADAQGQPIFDSGLIAGSVFDWPLVTDRGQNVDSGTYSYVITINMGPGQSMRTYRGRLAIERMNAIYRVVSTEGEPSADVALNVISAESSNARTTDTGEIANATGGEALPHSLGRQTFGSVQPYISGSGTTGRMTKWIDGATGVVGDTNVTEDNGNVVVGNGSFKGNLQIFGGATADVYAGMGFDLISGPGFNYGYAGASFGRSAGFFNVRPDASASPPNPSLRFMTTNVERMIITNTGKVGIGTSAPVLQLRVAGGQQWTTDNWTGSIELDSGAAIAWRPIAGYSAGIGHNGGGMYFFHTQSPPGAVDNPPSYHMFINPVGNVGIGKTSPSYKLDVAGLIGATGLYVQNVYGQDPGAGTGVYGSSNNGIAVNAQTVNGTGLRAHSNSSYGVFGTSDTGYAVRASSNSNYGVYAESQTNTAVRAISIGGIGVVASSSNNFGVFASSGSSYAGFFQGNVYVTGTVTQSSDLRLKGNLTNLRYGLRDVLRLRPVTWTWKDRPDHGPQLGLIAQEVEPVIPELVTRGKDDDQTLGLNYIGLVPVVIQAIQEQQITIQEQQGAISRLTEENAALKARLAAIEQAFASMERPPKK